LTVMSAEMLFGTTFLKMALGNHKRSDHDKLTVYESRW
jgi:hypothetical protein